MEKKPQHNEAFENVVVIKPDEEEIEEVRQLNIKIARAQAEYEVLQAKALSSLLEGPPSKAVELEDEMHAKYAEIEKISAALKEKYTQMRKEDDAALAHSKRTQGLN